MAKAINEREIVAAILMEVTENGRYSHIVLRAVSYTHLLRYICKKTNLTETQMKAGDVTGDEKVTIEDLRKILRYVCKKITEL